MSFSMGLTMLPFVFFVPLPHGHWGGVIVAVLVHWIYQFSMIKALHRGDLSLVFPVMRGCSPILTAILAFAVLKEELSALSVFGLMIASTAIIVFALPTATDHKQRKLDAAALFWAGLTAVGIALYSVVDASVARQIPETMTFVVWLFLLDWIGITAVMLYTRRGRVWTSVRPQLKNGFFGGFVGAISYGAAIFAFTMMDTALVTALRETSVVFAALLGYLYLKEGFGLRRIAAAAALAAGLALMQINH